MASSQTLTLVLSGSLGVGIQRAEDGTCVVTSKSNAQCPLQVGDAIVQLNTIKMKDVRGDIREVVRLFHAFTASSVPKKLMVHRPVANTKVGPILPVMPTPTKKLAIAASSIEQAAAAADASLPIVTNDHKSSNDAQAEKPSRDASTDTLATAAKEPTSPNHTANRCSKSSTDAKTIIPANNSFPDETSRSPTDDTSVSSSSYSLSDISTCDRKRVATTPKAKARAAKAPIPTTVTFERKSSTDAKEIEDDTKPAEEVNLARPTNKKERRKARKAGWVPPLDIVAESKAERKYYEKFEYPYLFREYKTLSDRQKEILRAMDDPAEWPVPEGYCTKMMGSDFELWLPPIMADSWIPFANDSIPNKFSGLVWNMLGACESGSVGGDACRMAGVLMAAVKDALKFRTDRERIEHLLGLTVAIAKHQVHALLSRGDPNTCAFIFGEIAKEWKKFFDPVYDRSVYGISDKVWEFAKTVCEAVQLMLKEAKKSKGEDASKYNFNYIRIPRPNRAKNAARRQKENTDPSLLNSTNCGEKRERGGDSSDVGNAKKKRRKPSEAMKLIERINAVEGVEPTDPVYDSCQTVREKIRAFLARDGMTKASLCIGFGNINNNSLNRFLRATGQNQKGNCAYTNAYAFFERLRILEGEPKSEERSRTEMRMPDGFDTTKDVGGRPAYIIGFCDPLMW